MSRQGTNLYDVRIGDTVEIVQKADQKSGRLTKGQIFRILTKNTYHSRGIKVQLRTGEIGRVQKILG